MAWLWLRCRRSLECEGLSGDRRRCEEPGLELYPEILEILVREDDVMPYPVGGRESVDMLAGADVC